MARRYCSVCSRPEVSCICQFITSISNNIHVIVLQHPNEVGQSKGSVKLLELSLTNCTCIIGENLGANALFLQLLTRYQKKIALLYPSEQAIELGDSKLIVDDIQCLILLDGTWKKAFKMYQMNTVLHDIPHIVLPEHYESLYAIRKTNKKGALSTLEASCHALGSLEKNEAKYQPLLQSFKAFNTYLLTFDKTRSK